MINKQIGLIAQIVELAVENEAFYEDQVTSFKSAKSIREQKKQNIREFLESGELQNHLSKALMALNEEVSPVLSSEEKLHLQQELMKLTQEVELSPETSQSLKDKPDQVIPLQSIFGLSNSALTSVYKVGYTYFQNQQIEQALSIFTVLVLLNPTVADFSHALGMCYQAQQQWTEALVFFTLASNVNPGNVGTHLSAIECCWQLKNDHELKKHIEELERIAQEQPEKIKPWLGVIQSLISS